MMNHDDAADDVGCQVGDADEMLRRILDAFVDDSWRMLLMMMLLMMMMMMVMMMRTLILFAEGGNGADDESFSLSPAFVHLPSIQVH